MSLIKFYGSILVVISASALMGATLTVDKTGADGAYTTIQAAVEAASPKDTVFIKNGVYDQGEVLDGFMTPMSNRVYITKTLTLVGEDREKTIIKGAHATYDLDDVGLGLGPDAVRCIAINADNVVISNLTITGGATHNTNAGNDSPENNGGGVYRREANAPSVIVDCIVSNNIALRAGAIRFNRDDKHYMVIARTWIHDNRAYNLNPATRGCTHIHSLITSHPCGGTIFYSGAFINCTFADNRGYSYGGTRHYNCLYADSVYTVDFEPTKPVNFYHCGFQHEEDKVLAPADDGCVYSIGYDQFIAPLYFDFRLNDHASSVLNKGDAAYLADSYVPEAYRYTDYYGKAIDSTATTVHLGCSQTAVEVKGGKLAFTGMPYAEATGTYAITTTPNNRFRFGEQNTQHNNFNADYARDMLLYVYATNFPQVVKVSVDLSGANAWAGLYGFTAAGADTFNRYPYCYDTEDYEIVIPGITGTTLTLKPVEAGVVYVKQNSTSATEDGSQTNPYKDLQTAIDSCAKSSYTIIRSLGGVFNTGSTAYGDYGPTRICDNGRNVRIVGETGPKYNLIVGEKDSDAATAVWPFGCGSKAVRAVMLNSNSVISGFTITGGHSDVNSEVSNSRRGAGLYLGASAQASDCIITNNWGCQGAAINGAESGTRPTALALRCYLNDNHNFDYSSGSLDGSGSGNIRSMHCGFVIYGSLNSGPAIGSYDYPILAHSTFDLGDWNNALNYHATNFNCVIVSSSGLNVPNLVNSVVKFNGGGIANINNTSVIADPLLASDLSLGCLSVARTVGGYDHAYFDKHHLFGVRDFYGNRLKFENGKPVAGAIHEPYRAVVAVTNLGADDDTSGPLGTNVLLNAQSLVFTAAKATTRPYLGMEVTDFGVTFTNAAATYTYTLPEETEHTEAYEVAVKPLYDTNWFVDRATGDDGNYGTAASPKYSLRGALINAISGDVVRVAAGRYVEKTMTNATSLASGSSGTPTLPSRAVIPTGVEVIGAGIGKTFIVGEIDDTVSDDQCGCGAKSVRCVAMYPNSKLSQVTLTDGRSMTASSADDDNAGGGVLASWARNTYGNLPVVSDCMITNCAARRGGGVYHGIYHRCEFVDNEVAKSGNGAAGRGSGQYNFYVYNSLVRACNGWATFYYAALKNCTFTADNSQSGNPYGNTLLNDCYDVENCIIQGWKTLNGSTNAQGVVTTTRLYNCVISSETETSAKKGNTYLDASCIVTNQSAIQLEATTFAPVYGVNPAVDAADMTRYDAESLGSKDFWGLSRIKNDNKLDIGAVELDFTPLYAAKLGPDVRVTAASAEVALRADGVEVPSGASFACVAGESGRRDTFKLTASVAADGACAVTKDGGSWKNWNAGDIVERFSVPSSGGVALGFAPTGTGSTTLKRLIGIAPLVIRIF